jgi:hypothetical protein
MARLPLALPGLVVAPLLAAPVPKHLTKYETHYGDRVCVLTSFTPGKE